jgi:hypothetical protein
MQALIEFRPQVVILLLGDNDSAPADEGDKFSLFDVCSYLMSNNISLASIQEYQRSKAYMMMEDSYVKSGIV